MDTENLATNRENWRSIDGFSNYEVSWCGRVRNATTDRILKGGTGSNGYQIVVLCREKEKKSHNVHVLVAREWLLNPNNKRCVDHIDGDKANNHYENLRWATHTENMRNRTKHSTSSSVYKGVSFRKQSNKWVVHINVDGKTQHVGLFANEREAAEAYNAAAIEHYGEFAKLNSFDD